MKQHLLRFALPEGKRVYPADLREALARQNTLPPAFFCYDAETGKPQRQLRRSDRNVEPTRPPTEMESRNPSAIPGIRIVGGTTWCGVLADEHNKDLLTSAIPTLLTTVTQLAGKPVPVDISEYEVAIKELENIQLAYFCRELVIKKDGCNTLSDDEVGDLAKSRIEQAIVRQAHHNKMICPSDSQLGIYVTDVLRPRGLKLVTTTGPTNQHALLVDIKFMANVKLNGFWFAGNLTARGYGRIGLQLGPVQLGASRRGEA